MLRRGPALPVTTSTLVSEDALANMPDDASVRVAHADLPGLTWLLDTPPRGHVVDRLRLKPGASVTAGLRPEVSGAPWLLVQAYAPEPWADKRAKVSKSARRTGHDVTVHADERVLVVGAASDRRLPMLAGLRPDTGEPVRVGHVLGTETTLSYNPNRRWVGRIDTPGGERILARMHAAGHAGAGGLDDTTASPVSLHPWLPGSPWCPGDPLPALPGIVATTAPRYAWNVPRALAAAADGVAAVHAPWGRLARTLAAQLGRRLADVPTAPAYGDLSPDQVIVDGRSAHILDWDRAGDWPLGWDAASWTASAIADGRDPASCTADLQALGLTEPDPVVLAAAALLRAPEPFRRRRSHWSEHTRDLLACALGASS